jgi:hypothetical protein
MKRSESEMIIRNMIVIFSLLLINTNSFRMVGFKAPFLVRQPFQLSADVAEGSGSSPSDSPSDLSKLMKDLVTPPETISQELKTDGEVDASSNATSTVVVDPLDTIIANTTETAEAKVANIPVVVAEVPRKDLRLLTLEPAYPDDTSYMMCSACKTG